MATTRRRPPVPAISLPLGQSREDLLLQVAAQLEQAVSWRERRPPVYAD
ncbi:hypothetical protein ACWD6R_05100 [Streptomyces sp. NPDC005151]